MNHSKINLNFRRTNLIDIAAIVSLLNLSYRKKTARSWTTEENLVSGERISYEQLEFQLKNQNFHLIIAEIENDQSNEIVACIGLTFNHKEVEIGTFAIVPNQQNQGLGKLVLDYAEKYATSVQFDLKTYVMWVLNVRHELIAFYARRGYLQTGMVADYPLDANVGIPQVDLHLIEMRKVFS